MSGLILFCWKLLPFLLCLLCVIAMRAIWYVTVRLGDVLEATEKAVHGFGGPLRHAAEELENAAGDIEQTTETLKKRAGGPIWGWFDRK